MVLDEAGARSHLLERGLIERDGKSAPGITLRRIPGRNLLYRIDIDGGTPILLKRAVDPETRRALERESESYDHLVRHVGPGKLTVPRMLDYDPVSSTLVLEFLERHRPLTASTRWGRSSGLARELGRTLVRLHAIPAPGLPPTLPWVLSLVHPPVGILREATRGNLELIRRIQRSRTWRPALKRLADEWSPRSFIHGDLRSSNILLDDRPGDRSVLALVDWELAGVGDPGWDAGWVLAEILARRAHPLSDTFPLVQALWAGYVDGTGPFAADESATLLSRTLRWAAVATLQLAYEETSRGPVESPLVSQLLEMGRSLLERTEVWIERVFLASSR